MTAAIAVTMLPLAVSCKDSKSYADLLKEEEHAVNWFMANQNICVNIPADSVFLEGNDAPYYKMDEDGYVYMQVVTKGNMNSRPQKGDVVYFRFKGKNIKEMYAGNDPSWSGNSSDITLVSTSLIYGNTTLSSTTAWGEGIQVPLGYLGYDSEVNLVIKSPMGFTSDMSQCVPYIYNIKYFKAEY